MIIKRRFTFSAAHRLDFLPASHKCHHLHGHNYVVVVEVRGDIIPSTGMVVDFAMVDCVWDQIIKPQVDHKCLNDIEDLEKTTAEMLSIWIFERLKLALPGIHAVEVWETERGAARYQP